VRSEHVCEFGEPLLREPGPDFADKNEIFAAISPKQKRPEMLSRSCRRRESAYDKFFFLMNLDLEPVPGTALASQLAQMGKEVAAEPGEGNDFTRTAAAKGITIPSRVAGTPGRNTGSG
jgi:hypothetical protein